MALKYVWKSRTVRPFALAGGTFRRINSYEVSGERFGSPVAPYTVTRGRVEEPLTQGGWVVGTGLRFDVSVLKISPEVRYTRWTSLRFLPTQNQVEFLLGVMF